MKMSKSVLAACSGVAVAATLVSAQTAAPPAKATSVSRAAPVEAMPTTKMRKLEHASAATRRDIAQQRGIQHSVAREWSELLLDSIRRDFARPTVHARNLYHSSAAMWDAWAAFDAQADQVLHSEKMTAPDTQAAREEAISYAMYRLLRHLRSRQ